MPPAVLAAIAQLLAFAVILGLRPFVPAHGLQWLGLHLLGCLALTAWLRLPWWWWPIQIAFPLAIVMVNGGALPGWVWLALLIVSLLIFGGGMATRVPLYLSTRAASVAVAEFIPAGGTLIDLGCGTGTVLVAVRRLRPDARLRGVESSLLTWLIGRCRHPGVAFGSLWRAPLAEVDVAYAFLSSAPMADLWAYANRSMRPGSCVISNTFAIPGVAPERTIALPGRADAQLYIYRIAAA